MAGGGDSLNFVSAGQAFKPSADTHNALIDVARRFREGGRPHAADPANELFGRSVVRAMNSTGTESGGPFDLAVFSVVSLIGGTPANAGSGSDEGIFGARSPGRGNSNLDGDPNPSTELIGVTLDPMPGGSDKLGRVCIVGVVPVQVSGSTGVRFCDAVTDTRDSMTASANGRFPIINASALSGGALESYSFILLGASRPIQPSRGVVSVGGEAIFTDATDEAIVTDVGPASDWTNVYLTSIGSDGALRLTKLPDPRVIYDTEVGVGDITDGDIYNLCFGNPNLSPDSDHPKNAFGWKRDYNGGLTATIPYTKADASTGTLIFKQGRLVGGT